jgi:hypothetical protein
VDLRDDALGHRGAAYGEERGEEGESFHRQGGQGFDSPSAQNA